MSDKMIETYMIMKQALFDLQQVILAK